MTINERRKYIHKIWGIYRKASKSEKSAILDQAEQVTQMHRKSLIRILNGCLSRKKRSSERGKTYGTDIQDIIHIIAKSLDYPCAERLTPCLVYMAQQLEYHHELKTDAKILEQLAAISVSTVKRILKKRDKDEYKLAFRKAPCKPKTGLVSLIPIHIIPRDTSQPGHFEVDTVLHCGRNLSGTYVNTLQLVDIATGWSEIVAICGSSYQAVQNGFDFIFSRLPFHPIELHPDNGSELINHFVYKQWKELYPNIEVSRSKPYRKNDNRFVEENNNSLIRAYIGHSRLDSLAQLECLRELYEKLYIYHNYFQPNMKLIAKAINEKRVSREYDFARPPLTRLLETNAISSDKKDILLAHKRSINPMKLRFEIETLINKLLKLPGLEPGEKLDYYDTVINVKEPSVTLSNELTKDLR